MEEIELNKLTDQELLEEQKQLKSFSILNAFLIGVLVGIILVSIYYSAYNISLIIPLFLIYKFVNDPKNKRVKKVNELLKERNIS
ncbi:hypothetical protein QWY86_14330 [Pedobacter aquatilis]|uniref:hypothetical protein n=1 Tax=Pedobacter aquatilis TaxID=351343 RepID=UPI0025B627F3|nr:hypothetical protein [Pedobacter aquatilis]MDN3587856.1 hypothetical protein [Pedobacter aquatilis]